MHLYEIQHEIKLRESKETRITVENLAFHDMINKSIIYLTCMVIMTNISHAEKTIKFSSDKKDMNIRTARRIRSTKLVV